MMKETGCDDLGSVSHSNLLPRRGDEMFHVFSKNKRFASVIVLAILVALYLFIQYIVIGADAAEFVIDKLSRMTLQDVWYMILYLHIITGIIAMSTGWIQFIHTLRKRSVHLHRAIGYLYSCTVLLSSIAGLYLAYYATGGWISVGFILLSVSWLYTLLQALYAIIIKKKQELHQAWMYRNYALTFAAVTLRIYIPISMLLFGMNNFDMYYRAIAWLCWVPNLIVIEWFIRKKLR